MAGFGAKAYGRVAAETETAIADPHRMVLMLFDGALEAIHQARLHMAARRVAAKCQVLGKAARIVDEGLKASVDPGADPELAARLVSIYQYITMRLLQANLRNDVKALDEANALLNNLRSAWAQIGAKTAAAAALPGLPQDDAGAPAAAVRASLRAYV